MRIARVDEHTISIGPLDLFCTELLHQIHLCASAGDDPAVRERLFPSPTGGKNAEIDHEWEEYVTAGLEELFTSNLEVIEKDLVGFPPAKPAGDHYTLHIPVKHLEAWIHGLNQARLALAARYDFDEEDMDGPIPAEGDSRALALFQVHFYGLLQECFLRVLEEE